MKSAVRLLLLGGIDMRNLDFSVIAPYLNLLLEAVAITLKVGIGGFLLTIFLSVIVGSLRTRKLCKAAYFFLILFRYAFSSVNSTGSSTAEILPLIKKYRNN